MGLYRGPTVCGGVAARSRRRTAGLAVVAAASLMTLGVVAPVLSPRPASAAPPGFVTRNGTRLALDGAPYRFTGLNIYNANSNGWCWYSMGGSVLDDSLAAIGPGKSAFRSWFFQQLATNGGRDWSAFDNTLATARARGVKVIATLIDQWGNCGSPVPGGYKDASWYEGGYQQPDPAGIVSYRDWVAEIVDRYKDDPTILAWQLVNEPEVGDCSAVPESTATADLKAFAADVSGLIKSIDANHLVSLGTLGGGQCGTQGADYQDVMSVPTLDLCEYHDYQPSDPIPGDQWNGLQVRLDQCNALNKPLVVGELGIKPNDVGGTLAARAQTLHAKLWAQFNAGVVGELAWAWDKDGSTLDNYDIGPGDPALDVLASAVSAQLSVADVSVAESDSSTTNATVTVSLSSPDPSDVTFDATTIAGGTATPSPTAHADYRTTSATGVTIPAGQTSTTFDVPVIGDLVHEGNETFQVQISNASVGIADDTGTVTIVDNDGLPALSIGDAAVVESDSGTTNAVLSIGVFGGSSQTPITVHYRTHDGTATVAGGDYNAASGTATIPAYSSMTTVAVVVKGDTTPEGLETLTVSLDTPTGATVSDSVGTVTIDDDEFVQLAAAGGPHTCARIGGFVKCWGANGSGEVGDGTLVNRTRPTTVRNTDQSPLTNVTQVVAGGIHLRVAGDDARRLLGSQQLRPARQQHDDEQQVPGRGEERRRYRPADRRRIAGRARRLLHVRAHERGHRGVLGLERIRSAR